MGPDSQDARKPTFIEDSDDPKAGGYWFIEFADGTSAEIPASEVPFNEAMAIELAWQRRR